MDPLSQVLAALKPRSYITAGFHAGGDWALLLDDLAGRIKCYTVLKGSCWISVPGRGPSQMAEGDCFILPSGCDAVIASTPGIQPVAVSKVLDPNRSGEIVTYNGGGSVYLVGTRFEIGGLQADGLLRTLPSLLHVRASARQEKLRLLLDLMMAECQEKEAGSFLMSQHLSHMVLAETLRLYLLEEEHCETGWLAALADPQLSKALTAMHARPADRWTLTSLARKATMSRAAFAKAFQSRMGETPISYLTRWRMNLAVDLMSKEDQTLAVVAGRVGYNSQHAFSTAFRRTMGQSPRRYVEHRTAEKHARG